MKITIRNTEDGLKLASCFGVIVDMERGLFIKWINILKDYNTYRQITLDLSTAQPCIYQCMKQGLKVEVEFEKDLDVFNLKYDLHKIYLIENIRLYGEIESVHILDLDKMEGVEIEEGEI